MILTKIVSFIQSFFNPFVTDGNSVPIGAIITGFFCFAIFASVFRFITRIKSFAFFGG